MQSTVSESVILRARGEVCLSCEPNPRAIPRERDAGLCEVHIGACGVCRLEGAARCTVALSQICIEKFEKSISQKRGSAPIACRPFFAM